MILLSEVAEKVRNEIDSWPHHNATELRFRCVPPLKDARDGDERRLAELLTIAIGVLSDGTDAIDITISGSDDDVRIRIAGDGAPDRRTNTDWSSFRSKAADWSPVLGIADGILDITLSLRASALDPPVDLRSMARETGLGEQDAWLIIGGFLGNGREHLKRLRRNGFESDREERHRAAHSLKGAGKTLRAPELASAARVVEQCIRDNDGDEPDLHPLEDAWNRIELWYKEVRP